MWRFAFRILFWMVVPRLVPRLARTAYLVWKLHFDRRVHLLLKLLIPASLVYFLTPIARVPVLGIAGYLAVLSLAVYLVINLAPRYVVEVYAPWRARGGGPGGEKDPSRVVEGRYRVVDEEEPTSK